MPFYLVSYDVSSEFDRYREKIAQILLDYGLTRIQYSVFFGHLYQMNVREIINKISDKIKYEFPIDIRFIELCQSCLKKSFIYTIDSKTNGYIVSSLIDILKLPSPISYILTKDQKPDIDKKDWILIYPKPLPPKKSSTKKSKQVNQSKNQPNPPSQNVSPTQNQQNPIINSQLNSQLSSNTPTPNIQNQYNYNINNDEEFDLEIDSEQEFIDYLSNLNDKELSEFIGYSIDDQNMTTENASNTNSKPPIDQNINSNNQNKQNSQNIDYFDDFENLDENLLKTFSNSDNSQSKKVKFYKNFISIG